MDTSNQFGTPVAAGKPVRADMSVQNFQTPSGQQGSEGAVVDDSNAAASGANGSGSGQGGQTGSDDLPELTPDQVNKLLAKSLKIENFDGNVDAIIQKINGGDQVAPPAKTAEQIEAEEKAIEKKILDLYLANGGSIEDYTKIKKIAASGEAELSIANLTQEMKAKGFTDEEIQSVIAERYYQINLDELQKGDDDDEEEFEKVKKLLEKKKAYGTEKLSARGQKIKAQAEQIINGLKEAIRASESEAEEEVKFSSNVDEAISSLPKKMTLQLGMIEDQQVPPVEFSVPDTVVEEVRSVLKDPEKRKQLLFNADGGINVQNLAQILLRNSALEAAVKTALLEGGNRQVAVFEKVFPGRSMQDVGIGKQGGKQNGRPGVLTSAGRPTPMSATIK